MWMPAQITELNGQMLGEKQRYVKGTIAESIKPKRIYLTEHTMRISQKEFFAGAAGWGKGALIALATLTAFLIHCFCPCRLC